MFSLGDLACAFLSKRAHHYGKVDELDPDLPAKHEVFNALGAFWQFALTTSSDEERQQL